jgi:hypothetical protein
MWFIPLSPAYAAGWFEPFLVRLLEGDRPTLRLLGPNPFPTRRRPTSGRGSSATGTRPWREWRETGAWWIRRPIGVLVPAVRLPDRERPAA